MTANKAEIHLFLKQILYMGKTEKRLARYEATKGILVSLDMS
jgi:hypothetical protein